MSAHSCAVSTSVLARRLVLQPARRQAPEITCLQPPMWEGEYPLGVTGRQSKRIGTPPVVRLALRVTRYGSWPAATYSVP
eukprot:7759790-Alexandrium_andersonii.AAC.1